MICDKSLNSRWKQWDSVAFRPGAGANPIPPPPAGEREILPGQSRPWGPAVFLTLLKRAHSIRGSRYCPSSMEMTFLRQTSGKANGFILVAWGGSPDGGKHIFGWDYIHGQWRQRASKLFSRSWLTLRLHALSTRVKRN